MFKFLSLFRDTFSSRPVWLLKKTYFNHLTDLTHGYTYTETFMDVPLQHLENLPPHDPNQQMACLLGFGGPQSGLPKQTKDPAIGREQISLGILYAGWSKKWPEFAMNGENAEHVDKQKIANSILRETYVQRRRCVKTSQHQTARKLYTWECQINLHVSLLVF